MVVIPHNAFYRGSYGLGVANQDGDRPHDLYALPPGQPHAEIRTLQRRCCFTNGGSDLGIGEKPGEIARGRRIQALCPHQAVRVASEAGNKGLELEQGGAGNQVRHGPRIRTRFARRQVLPPSLRGGRRRAGAVMPGASSLSRWPTAEAQPCLLSGGSQVACAPPRPGKGAELCQPEATACRTG